ncbi:hypothetical protein [Streptomyces naphthomycinicus]|uniref:hypothetical protein n=1 Tax=Streptomyces naphthomycinicus TaxID=2872625 RepID=UPI001CEE0499|nr:hypothetical protein [Streptomyces sp. TML10]
MNSPRTSLRVAVPMALSALVLSVAGSLSPASATTYWSYTNDYEGTCLTSSTSTDSVWTAACDDSLVTRNWYWGSETFTDWTGITYRRLVSRANGDCLTTDGKTNTNAVWTAPCGGARDQWWNADYREMYNANGNYLRSSGNGDAVYASPWGLSGIEETRYKWYGAHS